MTQTGQPCPESQPLESAVAASNDLRFYPRHAWKALHGEQISHGRVLQATAGEVASESPKAACGLPAASRICLWLCRGQPKD